MESPGNDNSQLSIELDELRQIAEAFVRETYTPAGGRLMQLRVSIEKVLLKTNRGRLFLEKFSGETKNIREFSEQVLDEYVEAASDGKLVVVHDKSHLLSVARLKKIEKPGGILHGNEAIFEFGRTYTRPESRGNGYYARIRAESRNRIRKCAGNIPILMSTKSEALKSIERKDGSQEITFEEYMRVLGRDEALIQRVATARSEHGYVGFIFR